MKPPSKPETNRQPDAMPDGTSVGMPVGDPPTPILKAFARLRGAWPRPEETGAFNVSPFPGHPQHRLAIDAQGAPAVLLRASGQPVPHLQTRHLTVQHDAACDITHADGTRERAPFLVMRCLAPNSELHDYFLRVVGGAVLGLPAEAPARDIAAVTWHVADVFAALNQMDRQEVPDLWGEIYIISRAANTAQAVHAWRDRPEDTSSFSAGGQHAEVKSALGMDRHHKFPLEQLNSPWDDGDVTVISLLLRTSQTNVSLGELIDDVRTKLIHDHKMLKKFNWNVAVALGNTLEHALSTGFDPRLAAEGLRLMAAGDIPRVRIDLPAGISHVRLTVDVASVPASKVNARDSLRVALKLPPVRRRHA